MLRWSLRRRENLIVLKFLAHAYGTEEVEAEVRLTAEDIDLLIENLQEARGYLG